MGCSSRRRWIAAALSASIGAVLAQPAVIPDSNRARVAPAAIQKPAAPYPLKSPGRAVLLSLLLPGGGQVYTGNWLKAAFIAPAELALGYCTLRSHLDLRDAERRSDTTAYAKYRDRRTTFLWFTGAAVVFSMADAYVSAQMYGFDREMRLTVGLTGAGLRVGI